MVRKKKAVLTALLDAPRQSQCKLECKHVRICQKTTCSQHECSCGFSCLNCFITPLTAKTLTHELHTEEIYKMYM